MTTARKSSFKNPSSLFLITKETFQLLHCCLTRVRTFFLTSHFYWHLTSRHTFCSQLNSFVVQKLGAFADTPKQFFCGAAGDLEYMYIKSHAPFLFFSFFVRTEEGCKRAVERYDQIFLTSCTVGELGILERWVLTTTSATQKTVPVLNYMYICSRQQKWFLVLSSCLLP